MPARFSLVAVALGLLLAAGCGPAKLNESKTLSVGLGDPKAIDPPVQAKAQTFTVEFSAPEEVTVMVIKESDAKGEEGLLNADVNQSKAIAKKTGKSETFTAEVPANTAVRVIALSKKKADVAVKLKN